MCALAEREPLDGGQAVDSSCHHLTSEGPVNESSCPEELSGSWGKRHFDMQNVVSRFSAWAAE